MAHPRQIDVRHVGHDRSICCFRHDGVLVDPGPESSHRTLLEALGGEAPERILLTHVHLDHAGATGALVRRWPGVEVWVHERGAPHLTDPSRLVASAARIYGDDMERLWGEVVPVPEERLQIVRGGERIGPWQVEYTPGHASHHVAYLHEPDGVAFVGDVAGVRIDGGPVLPPTPPPDIDLEAWLASVDLVAGWRPEALAITHFGLFGDVAGQLGAIREGLERWGALARDVDGDAYAAAIEAEVRAKADPHVAEAYLDAMPPWMLWGGWDRYWRRRNG